MEYESVRRTLRYFLVVDIEVTDTNLEIQIRARTKTLSLCGCGADTSTVFPKGTSVRVKLSHRGAEVTVLGRVVYSGSELGMGVAFTSLGGEDARILECWMEESVSQ